MLRLPFRGLRHTRLGPCGEEHMRKWKLRFEKEAEEVEDTLRREGERESDRRHEREAPASGVGNRRNALDSTTATAREEPKVDMTERMARIVTSGVCEKLGQHRHWCTPFFSYRFCYILSVAEFFLCRRFHGAPCSLVCVCTCSMVP